MKKQEETRVKKGKKLSDKPRVTWAFNPSSKVVQSKKKYNRKRDKQTFLRQAGD